MPLIDRSTGKPYPPTFFVVDVETTDTDPRAGFLLTVGVQPVVLPDNDPSRAELTDATFYARIDRTEYYREWFATLTDPGSTLSWWLKQNPEAQAEAFRNTHLDRYRPKVAARMLCDFVLLQEPQPEARVFVANPVTFDKGWIDDLWHETRVRDPFHYRTLCLRSMRYGLDVGDGWGAARDDHDPQIPHHALFDAQAQARDLVRMLKRREGAANV